MKNRVSWQQKIDDAFHKRSILWLSGVRRSGKTLLCQSIAGTEYFDCELPSTRRMTDAPEAFLKGLPDKLIILDGIHRLANPSELLKIAADHYPHIRIIATGSSTLGASARFSDTLAGRKTDLWLTPMTSADGGDFGDSSLERRMLQGGLPPFFLDDSPSERDYQEWVDGYWAKDILELFRLERRHSFQKLLELLLVNSGGVFEATKYARPCEVSRTTIANYLAVLEATFVAHVIRPFNSYKPAEIVAAPKVYGFDTGFVCCFRGWNSLRPDDMGILWEHLVLNELHGCLQTREINYWRDKRGNEVDFVIPRRRGGPVAIECKWRADQFDPGALKLFRGLYPEGASFLVARDVERSYSKRFGDHEVQFCNMTELIFTLQNMS
jgi:predicted AAA+ superfamily ATPase